METSPLYDSIILKKMEFFGFHGVEDLEREQGQRFLVDVTCRKDLRLPGSTDDIGVTCNYAEIYSTVRRIVEGAPFKLIESVAELIAERILQVYPVREVTVRVSKPDVLLGGALDYAAVEIRRIIESKGNPENQERES
jgi:dihydroneopterin aldolase